MVQVIPEIQLHSPQIDPLIGGLSGCSPQSSLLVSGVLCISERPRQAIQESNWYNVSLDNWQVSMETACVILCHLDSDRTHQQGLFIKEDGRIYALKYASLAGSFIQNVQNGALADSS